MCGISGVWELSGNRVDKDVLVRMTDALIHRGPDERGIYLGDHVGLGHRRLSIIDLSGGKQPLCNEDGTIWVVFNGEIYNFQELAEILKVKGHVFKTRSDTEVIVHAYEEWGEDCIERFRGMFAFALWNSNQREMFLGRDRLGKKPLYYYQDQDKFLFSSEVKSILQYPEVPREVNLQALSDYLSLGYVPSPKSMFRGIFKVPPGCYLVCNQVGVRVQRYWDLKFSDETSLTFEKAADRLREILFEAVKIRLISEVPLGAFLSGGVDSASVVAVMAHLLGTPVKTASVGFSEANYDETRFARQVSGRYKTDHHECTVTPDAVDVLERLCWFYDEPFGDSSSIPTYYVSKLARQRVTVALSGDGGDENFAGYRRYYFDQRENKIRAWLPVWFRTGLIGPIAGLYPKADYLPRVFRGKSFLTNISKSPLEGYFRSVSTCNEEDIEQLLHSDARKTLEGYRSLSVFEEHYAAADSRDLLSKIQYLDFKTYLPEDILVKVDRASMANSLEVRCPLLDHQLIEFVATLPPHYKLRGVNGKLVFKKAVEDLVPESILRRKKMGFAMPVSEWLRGQIRDFSMEVLFKGSNHGLFDVVFLQRIWQEHQQGFRNWATTLWGILIFNLWYQKYILGVECHERPQCFTKKI